MKIKRLTIYGYGKWVQQDIDFTHNFSVISGRNEAGKSTIQNIIQGILFGFSKKNSYHPKQIQTDQQIGGKLYISDTEFGDITIERVIKGKSKQRVTIKNASGELLPDSTLNTLLHHLTTSDYEQFFSLTLEQLHALKALQSTQLNRYFLTLGQTGNERLFDLKEKWQKEAVKLFKTNGSVLPLNVALDELYTLQLKKDALEQQQEAYVLLEQSLKEVRQSIAHIKERNQQLHSQKSYYEQLQSKLTLFHDYQTLKQEQLTFNHQLPDDIIDQYDKHKTQKEVVTHQLLVAKERLYDQQLPHELVWFRQQSEAIKQGVKQLPQVEKLLQQLATLSFKIDYLTEDIDKELNALQLSSVANLPKRYDLDDEGISLLQQQHQLTQHRQQLEQTKQQQEKEVTFFNTEKDVVYRQIQQRVRAIKTPIVQTNNTYFGISVGVGLLTNFIASLVTHSQLLSSIIGVLFCSLVCLMGYQKQQQIKQHALDKQQQQQKEVSLLNAQLQRYNDTVAELEQQLQQTRQLMTSVTTEHTQLEQDIQQYKEKWHIASQLTLEQLHNKQLQSVVENVALRTQLQQSYVSSCEHIDTVKQYYHFYEQYAQLPVETDATDVVIAFRQLIIAFKHFVDQQQVLDAKWTQKEENTQLKQRDVHALEVTLQQLQTKEALWLKQANMTQLSDFELLLQAIHKQKRLTEQLRQYELQLGDQLDTLLQLETTDDVIIKQQLLVEEMQHLQETQHNNLERQVQLNQQKQALETDGQLQYVRFAYEQQKEQVLLLMQEVGQYYVANQMIDVLLANDDTDWLVAFINRMNALFKQLTNGRYTKFVLENDVFKVVRCDDIVFELHELSQGTIDQCYIAMRLAFVQLIQKQVNLPIIIDDCFVNFDAVRKSNMLSVLKDMSQTHQMIYLTYDTTVQDDTMQLIDLNALAQ